MEDFNEFVETCSCIMDEYKKATKLHKKYPESHIFDEDQSVKWNKEEVQRKNREIDCEFECAKNQYTKRMKKLETELYELICKKVAYPITHKQAEIIWDRAYDEGNSYGLKRVVLKRVVGCLEDLIMFINNIVQEVSV